MAILAGYISGGLKSGVLPKKKTKGLLATAANRREDSQNTLPTHEQLIGPDQIVNYLGS